MYDPHLHLKSMQMRFSGLIVGLFFGFTATQGQVGKLPSADTLYGSANEIVVTATRTEKKLGNVAVPVTLISSRQIAQAGSVRLADILQEQAGLFITTGFGAGVQMQGLNPDYTLILLNGEPLVGRTAGILDLNRITVGNIKQIEIVKGPSSSLYGSEAMAGVINIITTTPTKNEFALSARYGSFNTSDVNVRFNFLKNKFNGKSTVTCIHVLNILSRILIILSGLLSFGSTKFDYWMIGFSSGSLNFLATSLISYSSFLQSEKQKITKNLNNKLHILGIKNKLLISENESNDSDKSQ